MAYQQGVHLNNCQTVFQHFVPASASDCMALVIVFFFPHPEMICKSLNVKNNISIFD